jgi:hypothetical protein
MLCGTSYYREEHLDLLVDVLKRGHVGQVVLL